MATEANGLPYLSNNKTGVGAVYFGDSVNLLDSHYKNLQMFDEGQQRRAAEKAAAQATTAEMMKGLKLDQPGILENDTPYFQERITKMNDFLTEGLRAGYDATKPGAGAFYNTYKTMLDKLQLDMKTSAKEREWLVEQNKQAIEKAGDLKATADKSYAYASLPYEQRNHKLPQVYTPTPKSFVRYIDGEVKNIKLDEEAAVQGFGDQTGVLKQSGKSDADVAALAQGWAAQDPDALEADWSKSGQTIQNYYASQLQEIRNGKDTPLKQVVADMTPQQYFAYRQVRNRIPSNNTAIDNLKYKPGVEKRADQKVEYEGAGALWDLVRGVAQDNLPIFDNYDVATGTVISDPKAPDELIATQFEPIMISTYPSPFKEGEKTLSENVTAVKKIKNDKNSVYVKTDKVVLDADGKEIKQDWKKMDLNTFANKVFANNYTDKDGNKNTTQGLEALKFFANKTGNYKNGTVNFSTPIGAGGTLDKPLKVIGEREKGTYTVDPTTGARTPTKVTPPVKTATKLSGKINPSTLVKGQEYEVNGSIYKWDGSKLQPK